VQTVLSAVIMCGPPSVRLDKPVVLSFPHCASVKHGHWSLSLFTSLSGFDEPPAWHVRAAYLQPNSITLAGSKLVQSWLQTGSKPNSITLYGLKLVRSWSQTGTKLIADQLRTHLRPASNQLGTS